MRILTRYILREVLSYALLGGVLFTFLLVIPYVSKVLELVVRDSASPADAARLILYTVPGALTLTLPMAVLVGILLGLSRLASDSEITAMRAAGMGALDFVRVLSLLSLAALILGIGNSLFSRTAIGRCAAAVGGVSQELAGLLRNSAARLLRRPEELRPLHPGAAAGGRRRAVEPRLSRRYLAAGTPLRHHGERSRRRRGPARYARGRNPAAASPQREPAHHLR